MKKIYPIIILLALAFNSYAQRDNMITVNYGFAIPLSETAEYAERTSWRNFEFSTNMPLENDFYVGFDFAFATFTQSLYNEEYTNGNLTVTGTQYRYFNTIPLHLTIRKMVGQESTKMFLGFGIGPSWSEKLTDIGTFSVIDQQWQFSLAPEAGINFLTDEHISPFFKVKYNYSPSSDGFDPVSYFNVAVGLAFF